MAYVNRLFDVTGNRQLERSLQTYSVGAGLKFDKVNDYVEIPPPFLTILQNDLQYNKSHTFSIWVRIPASFFTPNGAGNIFQCINNSNYGSLTVKGFNIGSYGANIMQFFGTNVGSNILFFGSGGAVINGLVTGQLVNFTSTYNHTTSQGALYVNGNLTSTSTSNLTSIIDYSSGIIPRLGFYPDGTFTGNFTVYDFLFLNKTVDSTEAIQLYNTQNTILPPTITASNILLHYKFNQKTGTTTVDSSTSANNGTLINFAVTTPGVNNAWVDDLGNPILA